MNHHIDHYFDEALGSLKQQIMLMGNKVISMVNDFVTALKEEDVELAEKIIEADHAINALEVAIDEQCIEMLARYQPAAGDLRFITRGLKIVTDLERIGDLAVNAAQRVIEIAQVGKSPIDMTDMAVMVQKMLSESLEAFIERDSAKAENVLKMDDSVDDLTEEYVKELLGRFLKEPQNSKMIFSATSVVRYFERIADHSTNIAELAIFMVKGRDVRHGKPQ